MNVADPASPYVRLAAVGLIREPGEGRWLLTRPPRPDGVEIWAPPGGRLEYGETLEITTVREMREEVGLDVQVVGPCYAYLTMHKGERTLAVTMACRVSSSTPSPSLAPDEAADARWATTDEWLGLAEQGLTLWTARDIERATTLAAVLMSLAD